MWTAEHRKMDVRDTKSCPSSVTDQDGQCLSLLHHLHERAHKAFGLPQWKTQRRTEDHHCFDRQVGEPTLTARGGPAGSAPTRDHILWQPHPDVATPQKDAIVLRPVLNMIPGFGNAMTLGGVELERRGRTRNCCKVATHIQEWLSLHINGALNLIRRRKLSPKPAREAFAHNPKAAIRAVIQS